MQPKTDSFGDKGDIMKGKTIIELKDVRSGKVQRVEHGNTFQSAVLSELFKPYGSLGLSAMGSISNVESWKNLVGGLLLFDDTIDAGNMYCPDGVNMVGNGAYQVVNTGDPVELGSWNESESYITDDEIVMTFDFTTSQANGSISSVALTSTNGGFIGMGNSSKTVHSENRDFMAFSVESFGGFEMISRDPILFDGDYMYHAQYDYNNKHIWVRKGWAQSSGIDLIKGRGINHSETYTISMPNSVTSLYTIYDVAIPIDDTRVGVIYNGGDTFTIAVVNVKTRNVAVHQVPKMNGVLTENYQVGFASGIKNNVYFYESYVDSGDNRVAVYDVNNSEWIKDLDRDNNSVVNMFILDGGKVVTFSGDGRMMMEGVNDTIVPSNAGGINWWRHINPDLTYLSEYKRLIGYNDNNYNRQVGDFPCYLATINNLEEPVVKDNTKTMKITYVLTRR